ncbi:hypothetical protein NC653_028625 [Populus alba x Populus x berolinensis]|uniref:Uncharacterized protein n=1 Tax=Populus alba x Populus x berolinensis TaxID=444605 RepID=A0AAD6Q2I7_9ROSI|nr:hypothetical protein NC653_028625 [Populus alba x Populus x berolinensis]
MATGMQLLSKIILNNGTFVLALMTYRHIVAAVCMAPFAFYFESNEISAKLALTINKENESSIANISTQSRSLS